VSGRDRAIVLVGLMGAGKTTVGRLLAERLGRPLRDSDLDLWSRRQLTASEMVARHGQRELHDWEAAHLLDALAEEPPAVVCAAASVVDRPECRRALLAPFTVWLTGPPEVLASRFAGGTHRPRYSEDLVAMLAEHEARRAPAFAALADLTLDVAQSTPADLVEGILQETKRPRA
jgi:shikimate kinase